MARRQRRRRIRRIDMQATEGIKELSYLEGLLERRSNSGVAGVRNDYPTYDGQVIETYRKYNGEADFGNQQLRATVDIRTSFIAGEGPSISAGRPETREWINAFTSSNRLLGSRFFDMVLGGEMTGKSLVFLRPRLGEMPTAIRIPWAKDARWSVILADKWDPESIIGIQMKTKEGTQPLMLQNFTFFRLGGDDVAVNKTTTRVGVVLGEFENYDRALKDLRLNNHVAARITPDLETESDEETEQAVKQFQASKWKIGKMRIGTGKFEYKTPKTGAADNLKAEMATALKTIAATTGIPVHWIGWADLMNNRATADSLYETINNATSRERAIYADGIRDMLIDAQRVYIDSGGTMISRVDEDIQVSIPVVDRSRFLELVRGLSIAYGDEAISMADYRSALPGVDPMETERQRAAEDAALADSLMSTVPPIDGDDEGDEDGED